MSRYIDADELLNPDNIIVMQDETGIDEFPYTYTNAVKVETILSAPTADVVEVVRCKDCKYCMESEKTDRLFCVYHYEGYIEVFENEFCSCGERKANDGT